MSLDAVVTIILAALAAVVLIVALGLAIRNHTRRARDAEFDAALRHLEDASVRARVSTVLGRSSFVNRLQGELWSCAVDVAAHVYSADNEQNLLEDFIRIYPSSEKRFRDIHAYHLHDVEMARSRLDSVGVDSSAIDSLIAH